MKRDCAHGLLARSCEICYLEKQVAELRLMVKVFRACIFTRMLPSKGSPCHKKVLELLK